MSIDPIRDQIQGLAFDQLTKKYPFMQEIGRNQVSSLYQAVELASGRRIALKVFRRKFSDDPRFALNFRNHMRTIFRIESEHLVSVFDYGMADGRYYIASEWIDGQSLSGYLAKAGSLSELQAIATTSQVCQALDVIHHNSLLHQNLKPENILLTSEGRVKLSDAGLSGLISESGLSRTHIMLGRYHYISPEQVSGQDLTPASDIYSLGVVLYEMLTGQFPFDSRDVWTVLRMHAESEPPSVNQSNTKISGSLAKIVRRALQKSPSMRFASASDMNTALTTALLDSVPSRDDVDSSSATVNWGRLKYLAKCGIAFLRRPASIPIVGKQYSFGIVLLAQLMVSFLLTFLFLTSVFMISRQIQNSWSVTQESVDPTGGSQFLQKSIAKTRLLKRPQGSLGNLAAPQEIVLTSGNLRILPDLPQAWS
jgi:serine/threonine protein kinase